MDILRKELNEIYKSQHLEKEKLNIEEIHRCSKLAQGFMTIENGCAVITDASSDYSKLFLGALGNILGIANKFPVIEECGSSDEDIIYNKIHPEDLVEKRMLEYEFFKSIELHPGEEKKNYQATCKIRMSQKSGEYVIVNNSTQIISPSPMGKIWLILCTYRLASDQKWRGDISAVIKNNATGEIISLTLNERRKQILSEREKEILYLIKDGKASKQIADLLQISINTVSRHRQNIIEKLSVANSIEAISAAESMGLL